MGVSERRGLKGLVEEDRKFNQLVADLGLDEHIRQEVVRN